MSNEGNWLKDELKKAEAENRRLQSDLKHEKRNGSRDRSLLLQEIERLKGENVQLRAGLEKVRELRDKLPDLYWNDGTIAGFATGVRDSMNEALQTAGLENQS